MVSPGEQMGMIAIIRHVRYNGSMSLNALQIFRNFWRDK